MLRTSCSSLLLVLGCAAVYGSVVDWTDTEVGEFVRGLGASASWAGVADTFKERGIDGAMLKHSTPQNLAGLGLSDMMSRRLLEALEEETVQIDRRRLQATDVRSEAAKNKCLYSSVEAARGEISTCVERMEAVEAIVGGGGGGGTLVQRMEAVEALVHRIRPIVLHPTMEPTDTPAGFIPPAAWSAKCGASFDFDTYFYPLYFQDDTSVDDFPNTAAYLTHDTMWNNNNSKGGSFYIGNSVLETMYVPQFELCLIKTGDCAQESCLLVTPHHASPNVQCESNAFPGSDEESRLKRLIAFFTGQCGDKNGHGTDSGPEKQVLTNWNTNEFRSRTTFPNGADWECGGDNYDCGGKPCNIGYHNGMGTGWHVWGSGITFLPKGTGPNNGYEMGYDTGGPSVGSGSKSCVHGQANPPDVDAFFIRVPRY